MLLNGFCACASDLIFVCSSDLMPTIRVSAVGGVGELGATESSSGARSFPELDDERESACCSLCGCGETGGEPAKLPDERVRSFLVFLCSSRFSIFSISLIYD